MDDKGPRAVVADESKYAEKLSHPVPVEVLPFAARLVEQHLKDLGGAPVLRLGKMKDGPVITDNGNFVMDADFGVILNPKAPAERLRSIPGLVEHGILDNLDELHLARVDGVKVIRRLR
ncbi:MAG: ribose-5-phosphate isomerase A [Methanothrix sp.]|nr:ribose-5-phosphate isomerase A [Methanothrix sp.]